MELAHILEIAMLLLFGFSWPFAIARTLRAKRVDGKSPHFMMLVIIGYFCGIGKLFAAASADHPLNGWVLTAYILDVLLVSTDLSLYFYYAARNKRPAP